MARKLIVRCLVTEMLFCPAVAASLFLMPMTGCKKTDQAPVADSLGNATGGVAATIGAIDFQSSTIVRSFDITTDHSIGFTARQVVSIGDTLGLSISFPDTASLNTAIPFMENTSVSVPSGPEASINFFDQLSGITYGSTVTRDTAALGGRVIIYTWDKNTHQIVGTFSGMLYTPVFSPISSQIVGYDSVVIPLGSFSVGYYLK